MLFPSCWRPWLLFCCVVPSMVSLPPFRLQQSIRRNRLGSAGSAIGTQNGFVNGKASNNNNSNNNTYRQKKGFLARKICSFYRCGTAEREEARRRRRRKVGGMH